MITDKSTVKVKGVHILTFCDARKESAKIIQGLILKAAKKWGEIKRIGIMAEIKKMEALLKNNQVELYFFSKQLKEIEQEMRSAWEEYRYWVRCLHLDFKVRESVVENITTTVGRTVNARRLSGNTTYTGIVNYTALGTDNTPVAVGQSQLGAESYRKALSSGTFADNVAYLETFFTASEVVGSFEEYAMFIDGTGSANSGQMYNRFLQSETKSGTETMNVQSQVTFNNG